MVGIDMAIIIPSSKIYNPQNAKIRDNVIERIEVGAVEVVPDNEYETPVYNEDFLVEQSTLTPKNTLNREIVGEAITMGADAGINAVWVANAEISNQEILNKTITIPKVKENKWIYSLLYEKDKDGKNQIKYTIYGNIQKGSCSQSVSWELPDGVLINPIKPNFTNVGNIVFSTATEENTGKTFDYYSNITSSYKGTPHSTFYEREISATLEPNDISNVISFQDNENEFIISIDIMASIIVSKLGGSSYVSGVGGTFNITGTYEKYIPTEIEITVYGNTIGIDLTDKTVYINGETAKKVHSIDGNELMQTKNYIKKPDCKIKIISSSVARTYFEVLYGDIEEGDSLYRKGDWRRTTVHKTGNSFYLSGASGLFTVEGEEVVCEIKNNSLSKNFTATRDKYKNGKETAVIRCSISDYYDENGEKIISIDKSTGRMSFKEYDEVVPMVYGADGKDYPMSLVNGKAKVFQILGVKKYYNGAVWQELSLQEFGELELPEEEPEAQQLTAPTISLDGNTLTMTATDNNTQEFVIFVDGVETATVEV